MATAVRPEPAASTARADGERRQLTVLFADVVGATTLSGYLDPEALRALLRAYQRVCAECIGRYDGNIHQYAGDGVLAYFGYPVAHDNDAERAVRAGLDIVAGVRALDAALVAGQQAPVAVRIGVHTGMVVVGEMGSGDVREVHAIGETPNVAARIQGEAPANSVCISAATRRLLDARFDSRSMGVRSLKGVLKDIELFGVDAAQLARDPETKHATQLVGREKELSHLLERWALARQRQGQAVLISGEGGLGKSRLLAAFRESAGSEPSWRNMYCSPFYQNSALHPMIDLIDQSIGRAGSASPSERSAILRQALASAGLGDEMTFALMASLVGLAPDVDPALADLAPDQRKRRTLDTLIAWLHAESQSRPLVVVVEDLHWIDASTRDLIGTLLERISEMPIMMLLTYRPEFVPAWAMHGQISTLPLARLTAEQCAAVALGLAGGNLLPPEIVQEVIRRTDGVPLYLEELTKSIIEAQASSAESKKSPNAASLAHPLEVPATLRDSLTARLDRLGAAKLVAQVASVLGREFDYGILLAICDLPQAGLEQQLAALNRAEIIRQTGIPPRSHYAFKHALIQEAAYDTLLKTARTQYHRRAAEAYVDEFPEIAASRPELVAHHFSRASLPALAMPLWHRAGEIAVLRSGYSEAVGHLGTALQELALLPESNDRLTSELAIRVKYGIALISKGFSAPEYGENYEIAIRIADVLGDSAERFMALWGDWLAKTSTGRTLEGARRSEDLVALSQRLGKDEYVLQAHHSRWTNFYVMGDSRISRADTLVGIRLYDRELHRHHRHFYGGHDPGVCACGTGANAAWLTGHADEALRLAELAVDIAAELGHPFSQSIAAMWATLAAVGVRDHTLARDRAESLLQLNERAGVPTWSGLAMIVLGAFRVHSGETEYGIKLTEEGLASQLQYGNAGWLGSVLAVCASSYMRCGNLGRASELLGQAISHAEKTSARVLLPENKRLQAEVLLLTRRIDPSEAAALLQEAVALAQRQGALALAWRATTSLARLHAAQGRDDQARDLLREQFAGPLEGFASPDLAEGMQLFHELRC